MDKISKLVKPKDYSSFFQSFKREMKDSIQNKSIATHSRTIVDFLQHLSPLFDALTNDI